MICMKSVNSLQTNKQMVLKISCLFIIITFLLLLKIFLIFFLYFFHIEILKYSERNGSLQSLFSVVLSEVPLAHSVSSYRFTLCKNTNSGIWFTEDDSIQYTGWAVGVWRGRLYNESYTIHNVLIGPTVSGSQR